MRKILLVLFLLSISSQAWAVNWCDSAAGCWIFSEGSGTTITDSSPNSNTGNLNGDLSWSEESPNANISYSTYNADYNLTDYIDFGSDSSLDDLSEISYTIWVYPIAEWGRTIIGKNGALYGNDVSLDTGGQKKIIFSVYDAGDHGYIQATSSTQITLNTWSHIATTWDGTVATADNIHIYLNGVEVSYSSRTVSGGTRRSDSSYTLKIGANPVSGLRGYSTEASAFGLSLDPTDINDIMDNGLVQTDTGAPPQIL
jgi:hypothetical protein